MKKKQKYYDDGHTIYNMDVDGMPKRNNPKNDDRIVLTKKEKHLLIRATLLKVMPLLIGVILCFLLAMIIIYLWLKP